MGKYRPYKHKDKRDMPKLKDGLSRHFYHNNKKEIDSQKYDEIESVEITDDFSKYKGSCRLKFNKHSKALDIDKTVAMLDSCIDWLTEKMEEDSKAILHVLDITTYLGISYQTWYSWGKKDERIKERQTIISEMIAAKVHNDGLRNKINPIGAIFSLKNQKPDLFKDRQEIEQTGTLKIDSISVGEVSGDAKRIESAEVIEITETTEDDGE